MPETRICKTCKKEKGIVSFPFQQNNKALRRYECRTCRSESRGKEAIERRKAKNVERVRKKRGSFIDANLYTELLIQQDGACGICREPGTLVVDHDHKTGRVRGLLCSSCNLGIGLFKDNPGTMKAAASYLEDE